MARGKGDEHLIRLIVENRLGVMRPGAQVTVEWTMLDAGYHYLAFDNGMTMPAYVDAIADHYGCAWVDRGTHVLFLRRGVICDVCHGRGFLLPQALAWEDHAVIYLDLHAELGECTKCNGIGHLSAQFPVHITWRLTN